MLKFVCVRVVQNCKFVPEDLDLMQVFTVKIFFQKCMWFTGIIITRSVKAYRKAASVCLSFGTSQLRLY